MRLRRIYENGGDTDETEERINKGLGVVTVGATIADSLDAPNQYGHQSGFTNTLKSTASFAQLGSAFGPAGTLIGGAAGLVKGLVSSAAQQREEKRMRRVEDNQRYTQGISTYAARAASDSTLAQGVQGQNYFENGGSLFTKFVNRKLHGGSLSHLSEDSVEVKGNSHADGGVDLPSGDEVEGGETIKGNYVLSKKLGFADAHKPLAKAIGILEKKVPSAPVLNSLERLRDKEQALILFQEQYRQQHNLA